MKQINKKKVIKILQFLENSFSKANKSNKNVKASRSVGSSRE